MCASAGGTCACRLSSALDRLPSLEALDLTHNDLPDAGLFLDEGRGALWGRAGLRELRLAEGNPRLVGSAGGNGALRRAVVAAMPALERLDGQPLVREGSES